MSANLYILWVIIAITYHTRISNIGSVKEGQQVDSGQQRDQQQVQFQDELAVERFPLLVGLLMDCCSDLLFLNIRVQDIFFRHVVVKGHSLSDGQGGKIELSRLVRGISVLTHRQF